MDPEISHLLETSSSLYY